MKKYLPLKILLILFVSFTVTLLVGAENKLTWYSFNEGIQKAMTQNKPMIVDFYADWCSWCKVMDEKTFGDSRIQKILNKDYILVRINTDKEETIRYSGKTYTTHEFQTYMKVRGLPTLAFFDKNGKAITLLPGFVNPDQLQPILGYISTECYAKNVSFDDYVAAGGLCKK